MLLAASQGTVLNFQFDGDDEQDAHAAVSRLLADAFGEEQ